MHQINTSIDLEKAICKPDKPKTDGGVDLTEDYFLTRVSRDLYEINEVYKKWKSEELEDSLARCWLRELMRTLDFRLTRSFGRRVVTPESVENGEIYIWAWQDLWRLKLSDVVIRDVCWRVFAMQIPDGASPTPDDEEDF